MNGDGEKGKITISIPKGEEYLLEEIDELVEEGVYRDRTEAFNEAIGRMTGIDSQVDLYDSAVSALYKAELEGKDEIADYARDHIRNSFPDTRMAKLLEEK